MTTPHRLNRRARRGAPWRASAGIIGVAIGLAGSVGLQFAGGDPDVGRADMAWSSAAASAPCASAVVSLPAI